MKFAVATLATIVTFALETEANVRGTGERELAAASYVGKCMDDNWKAAGNNGPLVCRAKEVTVQRLEAVLSDSTCVKGEKITLSLEGDVKYNAERYDPGWYIGVDGNDAYTGNCTVTSLGKGGSYELTNNGQVVFDKDEGHGNAAGDVCGDIMIPKGKGTVLTTEIITDTEITCEDSDGDGILDVGICFSWRVKGKDGICNPRALFPGTNAKCFCERAAVSNIQVVDPTGAPTASPSASATIAPTSASTFADSAWGSADSTVTDWVEYPAIDAYVFGGIKSGDPTCLHDLQWYNFVSEFECAANEVNLQTVSASPAGSCVEGEMVTVTLLGDVSFISGRHDAAWYIATDGGDALTGFCERTVLEEGKQFVFSYGTGAVAFEDDDVCGSILSAGETTLQTELLIEQEILCTDTDDDGLVDFSLCFTWNDGVSSETCDPAMPSPGNAFDCDCSRHNLPEILVVTPTSDVVPPC